MSCAEYLFDTNSVAYRRFIRITLITISTTQLFASTSQCFFSLFILSNQITQLILRQVDNPDQRITEGVNDFCNGVCNFLFGSFQNP